MNELQKLLRAVMICPASIVTMDKMQIAPNLHQLFADHRVKVYNFCLRMVGQRQTAEDLTQDIFLQLLEAGRPVQPAMLYTVARSRCLDNLRRQNSFKRILEKWLAGPSTSPPPGQDPNLWLLQQLNPRYRALLLFKHYLGLSYEEMAQALGTTPNSIAPMLHRAHLQASKILRGQKHS